MGVVEIYLLVCEQRQAASESISILQKEIQN
jgi:hypothetical protein